MARLLKLIAKFILLAIVAFHVGPLLVWLLGLVGYMNLGNSYIANINTPKHEYSEEYLSELNDRGFGEVVKSEGLRPIFVVEDNLNLIEKDSYTLGATWALPAYCLIIMDENINNEDTYRQTLWHEYLHCFYYGHSNIKHDIMEAYLDPRLDEDSVDNYLKELKEIYE